MAWYWIVLIVVAAVVNYIIFGGLTAYAIDRWFDDDEVLVPIAGLFWPVTWFIAVIALPLAAMGAAMMAGVRWLKR